MWVTITQVIRRSRMISSTRSSTFRAEFSSSAEVGSSRRRISGSFARVRAIDALRVSAGKIAHASFLISRQVDALEEGSNLIGWKRLPALKRPVCDVMGDGSRKKIRRLHDHADTLPQLPRRQLAVVCPLNRMMPLVGSSSLFSRRRKDVFPDPLGPTMARTSPTCTCTLILFTRIFPATIRDEDPPRELASVTPNR